MDCPYFDLIIDPMPVRPFEEVGIELFDYTGKNYAVYVDRLSVWPIVRESKNHSPNTSNICKIWRDIFISTGIPTKLWSDGSRQFTSAEF